MLLATLPPPHLEQMKTVSEESLIDGFRFNVGARTPYTSRQTLELILAGIGNKTLIVDLKGRQLRITKWADPAYGDIELNHEIKVDLPATIIFRGSNKSTIVAISGKKIFVDPDPPEALGAGQAVNIHGSNLEIIGYLTDTDEEYIKAAMELSVHRYMLSFVEGEKDISDLLAIDQEAIIYAKIESLKGLEFVKEVYPALRDKIANKITLVAALDDLYINIGEDKTAIFEALELIVRQDPEAIAASRIFTSLEGNEIVSMSDLTNFRFLESIGYRSFMLSDNLCNRRKIFKSVMAVIKQYQARFNNR